MPSRERIERAMVRWSDGLYGGLIGAFVSALFFIIIGSAVEHDAMFGEYFVRFAVGIFGSKAENIGIIALLFGLFLHFFAGAILGVCYALVAQRVKPMWTAPGSIMSGIIFGFIMFFIAEDVVVPVLHVISYQPAWEGLVGNVFFHGLIVSEYITIAHRRNLASGMS